LKSKKPDPIKGKSKINPPEKKLSFEEVVQKYDEYIHGPERFNKIFSELDSGHVEAEGEASCDKKKGSTICASTKASPKSEKNTKKVSPLKRK
jgi:hypothetical protein